MNRFRPELHVTAETGVLEASAGAVRQGNSLHVFHQFRPTTDSGARWAHQVATGLPYGWDVCDDVLAPENSVSSTSDTASTTSNANKPDEIDCLAGSSVPIDNGVVELFFVTTSAAQSAQLAEPANPTELLGSHLPHGLRGARNFCIQRARINDLDLISTEISDDPSIVRNEVERLGPIDVDDSAYPVDALVSPSVFRRDTHWIMLALALVDDTAATIVVLSSTDRQQWIVRGPLDISGDDDLPEGRPFAPRIVSMTDEASHQQRDVLFITYSFNDGASDNAREVAGYFIGTLNGTTFQVENGFQIFDHGHDFTRPRVAGGEKPVLLGLVGTFPGNNPGTWANCLSLPRFLRLRSGHVYQDIVGVPAAVRSYTNRAAVITAQLDVSRGSVTVTLLDEADRELAAIRHSGDRVEVSRPLPPSETSVSEAPAEICTALLGDSDSDTLTVLIDGSVCEVFADGGLVSLTSALSGNAPFARFRVDASGGARVLSAMESMGRQLQRQLAQLDSPEEQERLIAAAALADRDLAAGIDPSKLS